MFGLTDGIDDLCFAVWLDDLSGLGEIHERWTVMPPTVGTVFDCLKVEQVLAHLYPFLVVPRVCLVLLNCRLVVRRF
jgi:hypothetical protein